MRRRRRTAYFVCGAISSLLVGYLAVLSICASRARTCETKAVSLGLSLKTYIEVHEGSMPPPFIEDGETGNLHSWRVLLLPHVSYDFMYRGYSFHESWNSPHNREFLTNITAYTCPSHSTSGEITNYVAVVGQNTLWPDPRDPSAYEWAVVGEHRTRWPSPKGRKIATDNITKVAIVELVVSDTSWTEPRDVTLDEFIDMIRKDPKGAFYNESVKGIRGIDASGQIRIINPYDDLDAIRNMFIVDERQGE